MPIYNYITLSICLISPNVERRHVRLFQIVQRLWINYLRTALAKVLDQNLTVNEIKEVLVHTYAYVDLFARDTISHKDRGLVTISVLAALGNVVGQLKTHMIQSRKRHPDRTIQRGTAGKVAAICKGEQSRWQIEMIESAERIPTFTR